MACIRCDEPAIQGFPSSGKGHCQGARGMVSFKDITDDGDQDLDLESEVAKLRLQVGLAEHGVPIHTDLGPES